MNLLCWISLLSAVKAREARHFKIDKTTESDIEQFDSERPNIDLEKGSNMGDHSSAKSLQSEVASKIGRQYVGVAVNIQNYSPFLLTDVQKSIKYGYSEPDAGYLPDHAFHAVKPKQEEVFLFHNWGYQTEAGKRNTRGSISWQIKRSNGANVTVEADLGHGVRSYALRLSLSWYVWFTTCASQIEDSNNKMMVSLDRTPHVFTGEEDWFDSFHEKGEEAHFLGKKSRVIVFSKSYIKGFKVKAEMEQGCQAVLTVQLLGPETDEDDGNGGVVTDEENPVKKSSFLNLGSMELMIIIASSLGLLGFIICFIMVVRMRKMGRAQRVRRGTGTSDE